MSKSSFVLAVAGLLASASFAAAAPLNLTLQRPDITSGLLSVSYNATSDVLTVTGSALTIDLDGIAPPDHPITGGTFALTANINSAGVLTSGSLTISGSISALGAVTPLLTANITAFGFSNSPVTQIFEFTGPVTGGSLASGPNGFGSTVGTILSLGGGFNGSFASNFSNSGFGAADTARIPAPAAGTLALMTGVLALGRRRR